MDKFLKFKGTMDKIFGIIIKAAQIIAACFLSIMIIDVSIQVIGRVFHFSIPVTEEIATYSLIWMTYIASIAVTAKGEHLTVDVLLNRYSPAAKRVVRLIVDLMILVFCVLLVVFGIQILQKPVIINSRTPALQISRLWIYVSVPFTMAFNSLYMVYETICAAVDLGSKGYLTKLADEAKAAELAAAEEEYKKEAAAVKEAMTGVKEEEATV